MITSIVYFAIVIGMSVIVAIILIQFPKRRTGDFRPITIYGPDGNPQKIPANARFLGSLDQDTILNFATPVVAFLTILVGIAQFRDGQRERTESETRADYIRATQLLTESGTGGPMAGITALSQLAENSVDRTWLMTESLSGYIRYTAPQSNTCPQYVQCRGPYKDPPCRESAPPEDKYHYDTCEKVERLYQKAPAVQVALGALGSRNRQNETGANVPPRFKSQVEAARRSSLAAFNPSDPSRGATPQEMVIAYINDYWFEKGRKESNRQLVQETQYGVFTAYPGILRRPWLNLSHSALVGSEARSAFLEGGNFEGSDLSFSHLAQASLARADLSESWLVGVDLFGADLRGANLQSTDTRGADLGRVNFSEAWMSFGVFVRANFWQADLSSAYLVASDMSDLETMSGARLDRIVAYRADFRNALIAGDYSERVCMRNAFLKEAMFNGADLTGVDLQESELQHADLSGARLRGADMRGVALKGANMEGADLSITDLRGVDLSEVLGVPSRMDGAKVDDKTKLPPSWPRKLVSREPEAKRAVNLSWLPRQDGCRTTTRTLEERVLLSGQ